MLYCPWVLVAMETHFQAFMLKYQFFKKFFEGTLFTHGRKIQRDEAPKAKKNLAPPTTAILAY